MILKNLVLSILRKLSFFNFNSNNIIVYDYTFGYSLHSKDTFEYLSKLYPERKVTFIYKKKSDFGIKSNSPVGIYYLLFSKYYAITVGMPIFVNIKYKKVIHFQHGTAIKSLGIFDKTVSWDMTRERCKEYNLYSLIIAGNYYSRKTLINSYCIKNTANVVISATPYVLNLSIIRKESSVQTNTNVAYIPTYRLSKNRKWDLGEDSGFLEKLKKSGMLFSTRYHPTDEKSVDNKFDMGHLIRDASIIISDYSSILFDAEEIGIPAIIFRPDHEEYNNERGLSVDIQKELLIPIITDKNELFSYLLGIKDRKPRVNASELKAKEVELNFHIKKIFK